MSSKSGWSNLYHYDPVIAVAGVAAGLYTVAGAVVLWQTIKYKKKYMHTVTVTAFCEAVGYYLRLYSGQHTANLDAYIPTALFLLLPPLVLAVASYRTLAHIMRMANIDTGRRAVKLIENAFLYLDIIAFFTQAAGSGMLAIQSMANTGNKIAIAGMAISCLNFLVFATVIAVIHKATIRESPDVYRMHVKPLFFALYINIICLNIRSIYRLVEFADGFFGYVNTHEVFFLVFDTLLIFICICAWIAIPAGKYLQFQQILPSINATEDYQLGPYEEKSMEQ
ncbi:hypothetical protein INT43_006181 [Umbelopsis isabellina]|uniref:RTA1-domain-containing protein n=1 Tax=Mortierella isabellina TaxID=91625 RepID=A0A8H7UEX0_MORIS|nr:hypothetical protein INT43_006181 [Umbelopsis isabellina]